jgi:hypothetical protein
MGTFVVVAFAGLSVVFRYLLVPSLMLMVFAALPLTGWTLLPPGTQARRRWALGAGILVAGGIAFTVTHTTPSSFATELSFRGKSQEALRALLEDPRVAAARRCGPISVPNHKLVPKARWVVGGGEQAVIARSDPRQRRRIRRGVAIYAASRLTLLREGYRPDSYVYALPMRGFRFITANGFYSAYVRC